MTRPFRYRSAHFGGRTTRYLSEGVGPPVVLLHGAGQSALDWQWVIPTLARRHRVIAPDLPGFGGSDPPRAGRGYSATCLATFLEGFLAATRVEDAVVVGNSLGGHAALGWAFGGGRMRALVLSCSAGLGREAHPALMGMALPGWGEWWALWATSGHGHAQRFWSRSQLLFARPGRVPTTWMAEQLRASRGAGYVEATLSVLRALVGPRGQREVFLDRLSSLDMPVLVVWGEHDRIFPVAHAHAAARRLPRGQLAIIPDCGHLPHVERPDLFLAALERFLDGSIDVSSPWETSRENRLHY